MVATRLGKKTMGLVAHGYPVNAEQEHGAGRARPRRNQQRRQPGGD